MKGSDLKCKCGKGAVDVQLDMELFQSSSGNSAISWHCEAGHLNISGSRPGFKGFQQMCFDSQER